MIEICGNKRGCEVKTNGYLVFNYSNLDVFLNFNVQDFDRLLSPIIMLLQCPVEKFYSISFHSIRCIHAASIARNSWAHLPVEQTGRPDHLSLAQQQQTG